jgi:hypothetical protein
MPLILSEEEKELTWQEMVNIWEGNFLSTVFEINSRKC